MKLRLFCIFFAFELLIGAASGVLVQKALAAKSYYEVLGVDASATSEQIKRAYRQLAKQFHPDKNPGNKKGAEEKFNELHQAYSVLSDPDTRRTYDGLTTFYEGSRINLIQTDVYSRRLENILKVAYPEIFPSDLKLKNAAAFDRVAQRALESPEHMAEVVLFLTDLKTNPTGHLSVALAAAAGKKTRRSAEGVFAELQEIKDGLFAAWTRVQSRTDAIPSNASTAIARAGTPQSRFRAKIIQALNSGDRDLVLSGISVINDFEDYSDAYNPAFIDILGKNENGDWVFSFAKGKIEREIAIDKIGDGNIAKILDYLENPSTTESTRRLLEELLGRVQSLRSESLASRVLGYARKSGIGDTLAIRLYGLLAASGRHEQEAIQKLAEYAGSKLDDRAIKIFGDILMDDPTSKQAQVALQKVLKQSDDPLLRFNAGITLLNCKCPIEGLEDNVIAIIRGADPETLALMPQELFYVKNADLGVILAELHQRSSAFEHGSIDGRLFARALAGAERLTNQSPLARCVENSLVNVVKAPPKRLGR